MNNLESQIPEEALNFTTPDNNKETGGDFKILTLGVQGKEVEIPYQTKSFEYSKDIQNKTGILGYERHKIPFEELSKKLADLENSMEPQKKGLSWYYNPPKNALVRYELLKAFTHGRFPDHSYNYMMGFGFGKHYKPERLKIQLEQLEEDRFLMQKVFGKETMHKLNLKQGHKIYGSGDVDPTQFHDYYFVNNKYKAGERVGPGDPNALKFAFNGLNVYSGAIFLHQIDLEKPIFGFDRNDKLFIDYLKKSVETISNISEQTNNAELSGYNFEFLNMIEAATSDLSLDEILADHPYYIIGENDHKLMHKYRRYFKALFEKYPELEKDLKDINQMSRRFIVNSNEIDSEHIPIFIGHPKMPQLRWGHATYASIKTKASLNILNIKHADRYPKNTQ